MTPTPLPPPLPLPNSQPNVFIILIVRNLIVHIPTLKHLARTSNEESERKGKIGIERECES